MTHSRANGANEMQSILKTQVIKTQAAPGSVYANVPGSRMRHRTGAVLSGLAILFLLIDSAGKLFSMAQAVEGSVALGYPASSVRVIGIILLICVVLYAVPGTALLGAILLTGYLGGAVAVQ